MQKPAVIYLEGNFQYKVINHFISSYLSQFKQIGFELIAAEGEVDFSKIAINQSFFFYFGNIPNERDFFAFVYQKYPNLPLINIFEDHPFHYFLHGKNVTPNYFPILIQPDWKYTMNYLWPDKLAGFIPHAGYKKNENSHLITASKRKNDILFPCSILNPEKIRKEWQKNMPQMAELIEQVISIFLANKTPLPLDQFLIENVKICTTQDSKTQHNTTQYNAIANLYYYIDRYLRNHWRLTTLKYLSNTKIPLTVFVNKPGELIKMLGHTKNIRIQSAVNFYKTLDLMQNYKIVLTSAYQNGLPLFSERIPTAMINGAVSAYSGSPFISTLLTDNLHGVPFNHYAQESLPDMLADLLSDNERLDFIAENGQQHAAAHFSNEVHAQQIVELVADFRQKMPC